MKRILFVSTFRGPSGYSTSARGYLKCLNAFLQENPGAFELGIYSWQYEQMKLSDEEEQIIQKYELKDQEDLEIFCEKEYEVVWFLTPNGLINFLKFDSILKNSKINTNIVVWETTKVPEPWLENYKKYFNRIIVPSSWNREVFENDTGLPVYEVPYLIDFSDNIEQKKEDNVFNILSISQWTTRKGFDILIRAYCSEFYYQDDVLLTIKSYAFGPATGKFEEDRKYILGEANKFKNSVSHYTQPMTSKVKIITGLMKRQDLLGLYSNSDIFCLPTRGEGFGLTIAEAISFKKPVIVPDKGGHLDYIHNNNFFVKSAFTTSFGALTKDYSSIDMKMIETDIDDLRKNLRQAYETWKTDSEQLEKIGVESRQFLHERCSLKKVTEQLAKVLLN